MMRTGKIKKDDKPCFQVGRIAHMMVLEPEKFRQCVVSQGPVNEKTGRPYGRDTKAFQKWQDENPGTTVVDDWMQFSLSSMPGEVKEILARCEPELVMRVPEWPFTPRMQCRFDAYDRREERGYDLKTIDRLEKVDKTIDNMMYWFQQGWYDVVHQSETDRHLQSFSFIFQEKSPPYRWQIVDLDDDYAEHGYDEALRTAKDISLAEANNRWPWWNDMSELHKTLSMPSHMESRVTMNEDGSIDI